MTTYDISLEVLNSLFGRDCTFVFATAKENCPSQRAIDTFYTDGAFWIVTHALSNKVKELKENPNVSLCNNFQTFKGRAYDVGHPLKEENKEIREKLIKVFEPWYFAHNNEEDENMCYIRVDLEEGFFHKEGRGYKVNFINKEAEEFSFMPQIEMLSI